MLKEQPCEKNILFPIVRNSNVLHQLRVNWYSPRVSWTCSKVSQGIFGILTTLNYCLAASFLNESNPLLIWEIACSTFCERVHEYRPYRVPVTCCVRLSFILIVMTHHSCNHFGDRHWQSTSIRRTGRKHFHHHLGRRNGSLREQRTLAGMTRHMGRTSLLDTSVQLFQARFSSFCFLKFSE